MTAAQVLMAIYALLLGGGGVMGFVKARSRPSLIAGLICAGLAAGCAAAGFADPKLGRVLGMMLAFLLCIFFGYRYAIRPKFMPSGLMAIVSVVVLALLFFFAEKG